MKIVLSERQKCVLAVTAVGLLILYITTILLYILVEYRLLTNEQVEVMHNYDFLAFFIVNIILGAIITKRKNKKYLFELWCSTALIFMLITSFGMFIQYVIVSRTSRDRWKPIDFILIVIAGVLLYFDIHPLLPLGLLIGLF
jgi:predicted metal-binding membrane protein